jgi:hypothetical protein
MLVVRWNAKLRQNPTRAKINFHMDYKRTLDRNSMESLSQSDCGLPPPCRLLGSYGLGLDVPFGLCWSAMANKRIALREARGKTVKTMSVCFDPDYSAIEVEFTDGTSMAVDIVPAVRMRAQYQHLGSKNGVVKTYRTRTSAAREL